MWPTSSHLCRPRWVPPTPHKRPPTPHIGPLWGPHGTHLGPTWVPDGTTLQNPCGAHMGPIWVPHGRAGWVGPRDPKLGTRVHMNKDYPKMHYLGVQKLGGQNFGFLDFLICSFFIIRPEMLEIYFFENSKYWPPNFSTPLTYTYFESPCCTLSLYQLSWNFVKGCRSYRS